jgi:lysophospholipase L1-like esterase
MQRSRALFRLCLGALALVAAGSCGSKNPGPIGPTTTAPQITCPVDMTVRGITGSSQVTTYSAPVVTAGASPVTTTCSPSSGASFPLGTSTVNCTATDAVTRQASCSFKVTLTGLSIAATKFDAVGDSFTSGENALPLPSFVDPPNSYPTKLQALFDATFPGQGISVINRGESGQRVERTLELLARNLTTDRPAAVLLLSGYNNLTTPCAPGRANTALCGDAVEFVEFGVRDCIREIKESPVGVKYIFVSTLTPSGAVSASSTRDNRISNDAIVEVNKRIRLRVAQEGATLVDSYPLFIGHEADYISIDGLHLKPAGYQAIADAFFAAIRTTVPQTPLVSLTGAR